MEKRDVKSLDTKRIEVIESLIQASETSRLQWLALGNDVYYAQANMMAVRASNKLHATHTTKRMNRLEIIDADGDVLDSFAYVSDADSVIGNKLRQLLSTAMASIDNERARDLDRFLEDLRA